jgi:dipeptidyl aminopeptidase/acylaminoacyl peptidase
MKTKYCWALCLILVLVFCQGQKGEDSGQYVAAPETIENDGVPPIPIEIMDTMKRYADLKSTSFRSWDPTGKGMLVATRLKNTTQIYKLDRALGELRQLTDYAEPVTQAIYCPDPEKKYFLFVKDVGGGENYQFFRHDLETGQAEMISDGKSRNMMSFFGTGNTFNHKGDRIAYVNNSRTGMLFDVYTMDPEKPETAKLVFKAKRPAYYMPVLWFPNDKRILVAEYISANEVNSYVIDTETGESEKIDPHCDNKCFFALFLLAPDGKTCYGLSDRKGEFKQLIKVNLATGDIKTLELGIPWDIDSGTASADASQAAFVVNEEGIGRLYLMDVNQETFEPVESVPMAQISGLEFDTSGKQLAMTLSGPRMNGDVYVLDLESNQLKRWTESDTGGLDTSRFVEPELIQFPTFDTVDAKPRMIPSFYYNPSEESHKPYPVLIWIHGGPEGQFRPGFNPQYNYILNEMGIAILAPNVRGSSGYGKSYLLLDNAEKREDSVRDIGALLDWVATRPELDKERVAVIGGSYGGYMVLASMFHYSDRLACGVDIVGISNFVTFLKSTKAYRQDLRRAEYGDEREIGEFLNKISPTTNAHKIKIPLFVIQGKNDPRVPWTESQQIMETVRKNGVPVWYQMATNEGHGFAKKDNSDFMYYSIVKFFQEYLLR